MRKKSSLLERVNADKVWTVYGYRARVYSTKLGYEADGKGQIEDEDDGKHKFLVSC